MYLILRFLIYKPVKKFVDARHNMYTSTKETTEKQLSEATTRNEEAERLLNDAKQQSEDMLREAGELAISQQKDMLEKARQETRVYMEHARANLELEKVIVTEQLKKDAVQMAVDMCKMILKREINAQEHQQLVDDYLDKLG